MRRAAAVLLVMAVVAVGGLAVTGCGSDHQVALPPPGGGLDYQLGGAYRLPTGVTVDVRDRQARPAGAYDVCYVNGFQVQTEAAKDWLAHRPGLVLRDDEDHPIIDTDWDEPLLDISTAAKRAELERIVGGWIDGCADDGYEAVEVDNLDSYVRSEGRLHAADALAFAHLLIDRAHADGLAIGQKNAADLVARAHRLGFDFAVAEECSRYRECDAYLDAYGEHRVLVIEYRREDLAYGCARWPAMRVVLRDRDLVTPDDEGYVRATC